MSQRSSGWWWTAGVVVVAAAIAGWLYYAHQKAQTAAPPAAATPAPASTAPPPIRHPIERVAGGPAPASTAPLPALGDSDAAVLQALSALPGADGLQALLLPQAIIPRIVATVDALPRRQLGTNIVPLRAPPGTFQVAEAGSRRVISDRNAERYAAYMRLVGAVDTRALVAWYVHYYPLFQQAYRELGYPKGYFNDRLVAVIDHLLAAPQPAPPIALEQPKVHYTYADPSLEALSVGQKAMIRVGADNEVRLKAKLRELRAALAGQPLPAR
ncbi:MAG: DUF3014 domain-containing protein [Mizugakiibacter sp.]|uniref:DUF3014 domain-containing protein n=1 Tax=Mizugakiibacter sp. TaxID=1972610 RepID=UPI0031C16ACC|nr:DUF3014 domain-containing protein [Xanthomonadaceae bacterium]